MDICLKCIDAFLGCIGSDVKAECVQRKAGGMPGEETT